MRPRRTAPAVCELEGPIITGPMISNTFISPSRGAAAPSYSIPETRPPCRELFPLLNAQRAIVFPRGTCYNLLTTVYREVGPHAGQEHLFRGRAQRAGKEPL